VFGIETTADPVAIHKRLGLSCPGEFALYDKLTGGQTLDYFANLRGGIDRSYQQKLIERLEIDPTPQVPRAVQGQQAEDRPGHRAPAPAGFAAPRRADERPRPTHPAGVLCRHPRAKEEGRTVFLARTSCPRWRRRAIA
jgi:hypothetical protein